VGNHEAILNAITLIGSLVGQLVFGYLADRYDWRSLYGLELIVVIFGTLGVCSSGYNSSMNILAWIMFWRFIVGLGAGAGYPLSAVITAESVFCISPRDRETNTNKFVVDLRPDNLELE